MKILDTEIDMEKVRRAHELRLALKHAEGDEAVNYVRQMEDGCGAYYNGLRRRCQTDPIFLSHVLGYVKVIARVHDEMFAAQVKPSPDKPVEEWDEIKENIDLDPRGTYKSTCSIVGSVQCIICAPNIAICKLSATKPLAKAIANEIGSHFELESHAEPGLFHLLFPEFTVRPQDRADAQYTAPCRTWKNRREATVMAFSIETSLSGWHFDILDPDDVVDNQNSTTPQGIKKVKKNYRINEKMLMPWGYVNYKGTIYDPFDLGRDMVEKAKPGKTRVLVRGAMKINSGDRLQPGDNFPAAEDVTLLFPELLSYEFLKQKFEGDPESFITQYMNDAYGGKEVTFKREELLAVTAPSEMLPVAGRVMVAWRFACTSKENMRFAAGAVGIESNGRVYVLDVVRGTFSPSNLAHRVVKLAKDHGVNEVVIEETPGARQLQHHIENYAAVAQFPLQVFWSEYQDDDAVRDLRIKGVEPAIVTKRLWFSDGIRCLQEVFRQFCHYGMVEEFEIPDVVARLAAMLPLSILSQPSAEADATVELLRERQLHDRVYGIGQYQAPPPLEQEPEPQPQGNSYGLDNTTMPGLNA